MKINIIGASGTGKSTLASALAAELQCAHFDSDNYFHYPTDPPYQKQRSPEDRLTALMGDLSKHSSWTLSGGAGTWQPAPPVTYSLIVFLYLPQEVRIERLRKRESQLYGSRIQSGGDMEKDHLEFIEWTAGYDSGKAEGTNTLPVHEAFLQKVGAPVLRLTEELATQEQVSRVVLKLVELVTDNEVIKFSVAKQFAYLMDQNRYDEAAELMHPQCSYVYRGSVVDGAVPIIKIYKDNFQSAESQLDEIQFSSGVVPSSELGVFTLQYLDRIRKGSSWLEHRCEQIIEIADNRVKKITHVDLPGEGDRLKAWFAEMGIKR